MCKGCPERAECDAAKADWSQHLSLRAQVQKEWKEATALGRFNDPKHVYEVEWRRLFQGAIPQAEDHIVAQMSNPFMDMALDTLAAYCKLKKVPLWLFIRAQMDTCRMPLVANGIPFGMYHLDHPHRWERYEKYRALLRRRGVVEHSNATDCNARWVQVTQQAAHDEAAIAALILDGKFRNDPLTRTLAIEMVAPSPEWAMLFGTLKQRANGHTILGAHLHAAAYRLATMDAMCAVTSCYWAELPDRLAVRFPCTWEDLALVLLSLFPTPPAPAPKPGVKYGLSWRPNARNAH